MKIEVGKVLKAQGIKGEIKIGCYLDSADMLKNTDTLQIGTRNYSVEKIRCEGSFCYVTLNGVEDRNAAETLRDFAVYADKSRLVLKPNRFFVEDLIGCSVKLDNGFAVGEVTDVLQNGAADVFVCRKGEKETSFPFLNNLVVSIDTDSKSIILRAERFEEVSVSED